MAVELRLRADVVYTLDKMSDEASGRLLKALLHKALGEEYEVGAEEQLIYDLLARDVEEQAEKKAIRCEKNRQNINKRWEKQKHEVKAQPQPDKHQNEKKKEHEDSPKGKYKRKSFVKPTIEQVCQYIEENGYAVDAYKWYDHYETVGWMVGKSPMKDWKASVRTWTRSEFGQKKQKQGSTNVFADYAEGGVW